MKRLSAIAAVVALLLTAFVGCAQTTASSISTATATPSKIQNSAATGRAVLSALAKGGGPLSDSFYACLLDEYEQGIPFAQIQEDCETKLLNFPSAVDGGPFGNVTGGPNYDPGKDVTANCSVGDPKRAAGSTVIDGWGTYSWGKAPGMEARQKGLSQKESQERKQAAIDAAALAQANEDEALQKYAEAAKALAVVAKKKEEDEKTYREALDAFHKAEEEAKQAIAKALDAAQNAVKDPNEADGYVRTTGDETPCEQSLREAREFLWECFRTNWKSDACQQLQAKMRSCPDPEQIYVDPEQGYSCAPTFDPEALKLAAIGRCEELLRPVDPDNNPCDPPKTDKPGHYVNGLRQDWCNGPLIYVDPSSNDCAVSVEVKPFGQPDVQQLVVWGLNNLGGPVVVLPPRGDTTSTPNPHPTPGPE